MPNANQHPRHQEYVLIYPKIKGEKLCDPNRVMLIRRNKDDWQKGKLNLVGGKLNDLELLEEAVSREFMEETGLTPIEGSAHKNGTIQGSWGRVHVCTVLLRDELRSYNPLSSLEGKVDWYFMDDALRNKDLVPNLKVIIPLCELDVRHWTILDSHNMYEFGFRIS